MKSKFSFFRPAKIKSLFSFKKPIAPIKLAQYPRRTRQETRLIDRNPWGDRDRDKVINIFDCKPMNRKRQDKIKIIRVPSEVIGYGTVGQYGGIIDVPKEYKKSIEDLPKIKQRLETVKEARKKIVSASGFIPKRRAEILHEVADNTLAFSAKEKIEKVRYHLEPTIKESYERKRRLFGKKNYPLIKSQGTRKIESNLKEIEKELLKAAKSEEWFTNYRKKSIMNTLQALKVGYTKEQLEGKQNIPEETHILLNKDLLDTVYKPREEHLANPRFQHIIEREAWERRREEKRKREEKETIHHELLHHSYGKKFKPEEEREERSKKLLRKTPTKEFEEAKKWAVTKEPNIRKGDIATVKKYYLPSKQEEDFGVRIISSKPELAYADKNPPEIIKKLISVNKGHRVYGDTIYTKEEYSKTPEKAEALQAIQDLDEQEPSEDVVEDMIESKEEALNTLSERYKTDEE